MLLAAASNVHFLDVELDPEVKIRSSIEFIHDCMQARGNVSSSSQPREEAQYV